MKSFFKCVFITMFLLAACAMRVAGAEAPTNSTSAPRILHLIFFVRQLDARMENSEARMFDTLVREIEQLKKYNLKATFLLQYDALLNPKYQELMKQEMARGCEVGGWWEITQPHVEATGLKWRGRYPWDWYSDVGFSVGYALPDREHFVDLYMAKFKAVFGKHPTAVGSWFIDEHTLKYMSDTYHIVASCNCKDQVGTDNYTLWGGYWNQAYYPSFKNSFMPAQTIENQIPVPIFRMLGSDPIYQYDDWGEGDNGQGVITLEPVYRESGMKESWVRWFLKTLTEEPCLAFNYAQAGQENSFTWDMVSKGLEMQLPIIASLATSGKLKLETLSETGIWFKQAFPLTPATAFTATTDPRNEGRKTVWYNSRFYRANLFWENNTLRFRDIHLFDENVKSDYLTQTATSKHAAYYTLPVVDGFVWSVKGGTPAGLRLVKVNAEGRVSEIKGGAPVVTELSKDALQVRWPMDGAGVIRITFYEDRFEIFSSAKERQGWMFELTADSKAELPFTTITSQKISATFRKNTYVVECTEGTVVAKNSPEQNFVFRLIPVNERIVVKMKENRYECAKQSV
ncbi:MAG: hypothetical protein WCP12_15540 [bacterium]